RRAGLAGVTGLVADMDGMKRFALGRDRGLSLRMAVALTLLSLLYLPLFGVGIAFAYGRSSSVGAAVAAALVEAMLLTTLPLDSPELEGVIAHELAHIANRDAYVITLVELPALIAGAPLRGIFNGVRKETSWWVRGAAGAIAAAALLAVPSLLGLLVLVFLAW